jgi:hypothetical protein
MFLVQRTQISAFEQAARADFEEEMADRCRALSPGHCRALGASRLRPAIHRAVDAAAAHGLTERGPVRLYIELSLLFGSGFDSDPQLPWAAEQLARDELLDQLIRAEALYERASAYLRRVGEPDSASARAALLRLAAIGNDAPAILPEGLDATAPEPAPALLHALTTEARRSMEQAYPAKCAYVGPEPLERLAASAVARAWAHHGLRTPRSLVLMALLQFAFGHRCAEDPFHPWIGEALAGDEAQESLEREATRWLRAAATGHIERGEA